MLMDTSGCRAPPGRGRGFIARSGSSEGMSKESNIYFFHANAHGVGGRGLLLMQPSPTVRAGKLHLPFSTALRGLCGSFVKKMRTFSKARAACSPINHRS